MITNSKKSANIDIMKAKSTGSTDADMVDTQLDAVGAQPGDAGVQGKLPSRDLAAFPIANIQF